MITVQEIARADLSMSTPVYTLLTIGWAYIVTGTAATSSSRRCCRPWPPARPSPASTPPSRAAAPTSRPSRHRHLDQAKEAYMLNGEKAYVSGPEECVKWGPPSGHCTLVRPTPTVTRA